VYAAAARTGARLVVVIHDHRLHSLAAGTRLGLRGALRRADTVVAHSSFVGDAVARWTGRPVAQLALPILHALVDAPAPEVPPFVRDDRRLGLHFGVLKRGYKGTRTVMDVAAHHPPGWRFGLLGSGSPAANPDVEVVPGYVTNDVLAEAVRESDATLLPYRIATQSGALVLAQALGSVPIATAVGGIPEQIDDGATGLLLPPNASTSEWVAALESLSDDGRRQAIADQARDRVQAQHEAFAAGVQRLVMGDG
jgi:glycosyltransferase involved in cell wall biosynthesis